MPLAVLQEGLMTPTAKLRLAGGRGDGEPTMAFQMPVFHDTALLYYTVFPLKAKA